MSHASRARRLAGMLALGLALSVTAASAPKGCNPAPLAPTATPSDPVELPPPLAHWSFDETEGDVAADASMGCYDCMVSGATWGPGVFGGALVFDGTIRSEARATDMDGAAPEALADLDAGTITLWLRVDDVTNEGEVAWDLPVLQYGREPTAHIADAITIYVGHGDLADPTRRQIYYTAIIGDGPPDLCFDTTVSLEVGVWYHYAVVVAPGDHRAYLDGAPVPLHYNAETTPEHHAFLSAVRPAARHSLLVGRGGMVGVPDHSFHGAIDDVRIYDRALTAAEIAAIVDGAGADGAGAAEGRPLP